jgi:hypothetical protein
MSSLLPRLESCGGFVVKMGIGKGFLDKIQDHQHGIDATVYGASGKKYGFRTWSRRSDRIAASDPNRITQSNMVTGVSNMIRVCMEEEMGLWDQERA